MSAKLLRITAEEWQAKARAARFCVARLARVCRVSQRTLERVFQRNLGRCPREWLHDLRMNEAQAMLLEGCSVKETAHAVGYSDPSHLSNAYKSHFQTSPSRTKSTGIIPSAPEAKNRQSARKARVRAQLAPGGRCGVSRFPSLTPVQCSAGAPVAKPPIIVAFSPISGLAGCARSCHAIHEAPENHLPEQAGNMTGDSNSRSGDEVIQKRSLASLLKTRPSREATSPCSFEMLRSLFLTVAILWFGMPHSVARGFEVEGRLEYRVQPVGQSVDSAIRHDYDFFVRVTDEGWFIRTRPLPETQRYYECGYDGKFLYEYVFSNSSSNSPTGYNGSGTIEKKDVPTYGGSMACFVWLAYASAEHLAGAAHSMMRPLWRLDDAFLSREGHRVRATWLTNSDVLGLPKELSMFDDGVIRWSDPDGRRHSEGRAAPFDKGFSCLKYRAVMITNVNGLLLPEISECSYFVPLPAAKEVSDLAVSSQVKIYSDRFFPKPRNDRVVPILRGTTQVDDLRFWTTTGGVPVVRYVLANTTNWPTMEDEFVKALVAKSMSRSSGYPAKAPQKNAKWVMYGFLIMTTVALFFTIRKLGSRVDRKAG